MKLTLLLSVFAFALALPAAAQVPQMATVQPDSGKIGTVMKIHGTFLGKTRVDEVYLTDHTFDMKVKVLDQSDDAIEIRSPPSAKPGRLQLLVKTTGKTPYLLEQPVYVTVEEKDTPPPSNEVAAASHD